MLTAFVSELGSRSTSFHTARGKGMRSTRQQARFAGLLYILSARVALRLRPERRPEGDLERDVRDPSATTMSVLFKRGIPYGFAFFEGFDLPELLSAPAWRTSVLKADSSTSSPSWMWIARRTFPSRLE